MKNVKSCMSPWMSALIATLIYLVIWVASLTILWCSPVTGNEIGYYVIFIIVLLPIASLLLSFVIGMDRRIGGLKWLFPLFFGIMSMLSEYLTFGIVAMLAQDRFRAPRWELLAMGAAVSAVGLVIGFFAERIIRRIKCQNKE